MGRKKKEDYATDDDLAWFDLRKYDELKSSRDSKGEPIINFGLWATVIRDRVELVRLLNANMKEYVTPLFDSIKAFPLKPLGFVQRYSGATSPSDTPTVKSITTNRINWLNDAMVRTRAGERTIVDEQLATDSESPFGAYAHIMVNLQATDKQICSDFKSWLQKWRTNTGKVTAGNYQQKINSWAYAKVVPYRDLELFTLVTGKSIKNAKKYEMLFPKSDETEQEAQRKQLMGMKALVFTDTMASTVEHLAENDLC